MKSGDLKAITRLLVRAVRVNTIAALLALGCLSLLHVSPVTADGASGGPPLGTVFSDPFGNLGQSKYGPRIQYNTFGTLIENTDFDVHNPDLSGSSQCFGVLRSQLWHAGEDLYDTSIDPSVGGTIPGVVVKAVANGQVRFAQNINYPGSVVIIEHALPGGFNLYSVYSHLNPQSILVSAGQTVSRGASLGTVLVQSYTGQYPQYHTGDDSHLHFEIRTFYDASNIYSNPVCNGLIPGRGYTYPQHPTAFPSGNQNYTDPSTLILINQYRVFLPVTIRD